MDEQLTQAQAVALYDSKEWETWSMERRCAFQLWQDRLCMPFDKFHESVEKTLGRPVWTHEFANQKRLQDEYMGKHKQGTLAESFQMLVDAVGADRIIVISTGAST